MSLCTVTSHLFNDFMLQLYKKTVSIRKLLSKLKPTYSTCLREGFHHIVLLYSVTTSNSSFVNWVSTRGTHYGPSQLGLRYEVKEFISMLTITFHEHS